MKKCVSLVLVAVMTVLLLCVPTMARGLPYVQIIASSEPVTTAITERFPRMTAAQMQEAIDAVREDPQTEVTFPEDWDVTAQRMVLYQQRLISCDAPDYDVTIKFWSADGVPVCVFFMEEGSDTWKLITCQLGDEINTSFHGNGLYVVARSW